MPSPCRTTRVAAAAALLAAGLAGCHRVGASPVPGTAQAAAQSQEPVVAVSDLVPGDRAPAPEDPRAKIYEGVPDQIAAGQRYFTMYNCNGCHFSGGGGIGPAFMDDKWLYGDRLDQIYRSIADGRPNGMPTWRSRIPDAQIWQIAAYVKSLSQPDTLQQQAAGKMPPEPAAMSDPHLDPKAVQ